jgi:hypothetical protein
MTPTHATILAATLFLTMTYSPQLSSGSEVEEAKDKQPEQVLSDPDPTTIESESISDQQVTNIVEIPTFVPPKAAFPRARVGGATRGVSEAPLAGIEALVPERVGLTLEEHPVLYWFVPEEIDGRAEFKLIPEGSVEPLFKTTTDGPFRRGLQRVALEDYGVSLKPDVTYLWLVILVLTDTPRLDAVSIGGGVRRVEPPSDLRSKLAAARGLQASHVLAESGIWYDALDALSTKIDAEPANPNLRNQRAALFEQVGLSKVAVYERSAGTVDRP